MASPAPSQAQPEPSLEAAMDALTRATTYLESGLVHDAAEQYSAVLGTPLAAGAHRGLAQCAFRRREIHEALGHLQAIEQMEPGHPNLDNDIGVVLFELGMTAEARARFQRATEADPENAKPWRNLLDISLSTRDYDGCVRYARRVLALDPQDPEARQIVEAAEESAFEPQAESEAAARPQPIAPSTYAPRIAAPIMPSMDAPPIIAQPSPAPIARAIAAPEIEIVDRTEPGEIDGVRVISLPSEWDDRGYLIGVIRGDGPRTPPSDVALVGHLRTGSIRAFHKHPERWEWCVVSHGSAKLVLEDDRADSPTYARVKTVVAGERNPTLVAIPPGVFHGWMALADDTQLLCVGTGEEPQLPIDEVRIPPESFGDVWTVLPRE